MAKRHKAKLTLEIEYEKRRQQFFTPEVGFKRDAKTSRQSELTWCVDMVLKHSKILKCELEPTSTTKQIS